MYPAQFFSLFPPYPRTNRVFVAMSFHSAFDARWRNVILPALKSVALQDKPLEPFRVDLSLKSDAILVEILQAIAESCFIFADITALHELDRRPVRNANVMYEVGIAHAVRLPEEVILFRSDKHILDFDIAGVRVHSYDPDAAPEASREQVLHTALGTLNGIEQNKHIALRVASEKLTLPAFELLLEIVSRGIGEHPTTKTIAAAIGFVQRSQAIALLLDLGAIRADFAQLRPEVMQKIYNEGVAPPPFTYKPTTFGEAMFEYIMHQMGVDDPKMEEEIGKAYDTKYGIGTWDQAKKSGK